MPKRIKFIIPPLNGTIVINQFLRLFEKFVLILELSDLMNIGILIPRTKEWRSNMEA